MKISEIHIGSESEQYIEELKKAIGKDKFENYIRHKDYDRIINELSANLSEEEKDEFLRLTKEKLTASYINDKQKFQDDDKIMSLMGKSCQLDISDVLRDFKKYYDNQVTAPMEYINMERYIKQICHNIDDDNCNKSFSKSSYLDEFTRPIIIDEVARFLPDNERNEFKDLMEKEATIEYYEKRENPEWKAKIEMYLEKTQRRQYSIDDMLKDIYEGDNDYKKKYGIYACDTIKTIEIILGKEKIQNLIKDGDYSLVTKDMEKYIPKEDCNLLVDIIETSASYNRMQSDLLREKLKSLDKPYDNINMYDKQRRIIDDICKNINVQTGENVDPYKMIIDFSMMDVSDNSIYNYNSLYWSRLYSNDMKDKINKLELIIGKNKIKSFYDNPSKLKDELSNYFSDQEWDEFCNIVKEDASSKVSLQESSERQSRKKRADKLIATVCKEKELSGLAEIFDQMNKMGNGDGTELALYDDGYEIQYSFFDIKNKIGVSRGAIDRKTFLTLDYKSFVEYVVKQNEKKQEKKEQEPNNASLTPKDIVNMAKEVLAEGSGGSQVCDNVQNEITELTGERNQNFMRG